MRYPPEWIEEDRKRDAERAKVETIEIAVVMMTVIVVVIALTW